VSLLIYNFFLLLYRVALSVAARFNPKARAWIEGRRNWEINLRAAMGTKNAPVIWMHCASLGEFEQGRPVLTHIRTQYPGYKILISFFSPSGYEVRKNYNGADYVCYLPLDGAARAKKFIDIVQPDLVLWIRYEFWYHYLGRLHTLNIPVLLISGLFRQKQPFFRWYGKLHRHMLTCFSHLFLQDQNSEKLLHEIGINRVSVSGDTRYDRVSMIAESFSPLPAIEAFIAGKQTIVAGSTWSEDEEELDHFSNTHPNLRLIIAPHEISLEHLQEIEELFQHSIRYSEWELHFFQNQFPESKPHVLIIDNIGMLSRLYRYATVAYIGGGFGDDGLHNILEAAVYGIPVVHGPEFENFPEAVALIVAGGSFAVENALELEETLQGLLKGGVHYEEAANAAAEFVKQRRGATSVIIAYMEANRLLTS
jgi:3-deoxy-D-manno-octulosonic-acid transferase